MKKILIIVGLIIVFIVGFSIVRDQLIKTTISIVGSSVLGARIEVGGFSLGLMTQSAKISNFRIYNPAGFPQGILLDMPKISVDLDILSMLKGKLHIQSAVVDLKEVDIVTNKDGVLNVDSLKVAQQDKKTDKTKAQKPAKAMPMQIDTMTLSIGSVVVKDYSKEGEPSIQVYDVGIKDKTYKNITSAQQFIVLVLTEAMKPTAIRSAGIYGAATILGVAFLPAGVAGVLTAKDYSQFDFNVNADKAYNVSLDVLKQMGVVKSEDKAARVIKGKIDKNDITIKIEQKEKVSQVTVSARKFMLPQAQIAAGVMYKISERLK
ncbi:MAG: hypothetical protein PHI86_03385 [Candidatus Omnitrophica bacterium]|nr:hypothetical protein [Candidatus Omnitrophota bacterium]HOX54343.1 hypothetical protein [Candidatus Omnitrophota bacterium]